MIMGVNKIEVGEREKADRKRSVCSRESLLLLTIVIIGVVVAGIGVGWAITGFTDMGNSYLTGDDADNTGSAGATSNPVIRTNSPASATTTATQVDHITDFEMLKNRVIVVEIKATTAEDEATAAKSEANAAKIEANAARNESTAAKQEATAAKNAASAAKSEADAAQMEAAAAKSEADAAKIEAAAAKSEATAAKIEAAAAKSEAAAAQIEAAAAKFQAAAADIESTAAQSEAAAAKSEALNATNKANDANTKAGMLQVELYEWIANSSAKEDKYSASTSTYVHWGRTTCDVNGTNLVYAGFAGGAWYSAGSAANYVCLTDEPTWDYDSLGNGADYGRLYGGEFQLNNDWPFKTDNVYPESLYQQDVPCAVCETVGRGSNLMIPGTQVCPPGWTQEYKGYLMSGRHNEQRTEYVCVDEAPEAIPGGSANTNGALFQYVRAFCGALPCPPYENDRETTCVVCTK